MASLDDDIIIEKKLEKRGSYGIVSTHSYATPTTGRPLDLLMEVECPSPRPSASWLSLSTSLFFSSPTDLSNFLSLPSPPPGEVSKYTALCDFIHRSVAFASSPSSPPKFTHSFILERSTISATAQGVLVLTPHAQGKFLELYRTGIGAYCSTYSSAYSSSALSLTLQLRPPLVHPRHSHTRPIAKIRL